MNGRPNLVNPNNWSMFGELPVHVPFSNKNGGSNNNVVSVLPKLPTKDDIVRRNSYYLNFFGIIFILCVGYYLYTVYTERKVVAEYLEKYVKEKYDDTGGTEDNDIFIKEDEDLSLYKKYLQ